MKISKLIFVRFDREFGDFVLDMPGFCLHICGRHGAVVQIGSRIWTIDIEEEIV